MNLLFEPDIQADEDSFLTSATSLSSAASAASETPTAGEPKAVVVAVVVPVDRVRVDLLIFPNVESL